LITLRFEHIKSGWCTIIFANGESETEISISYLTDFIRDFVNTIASMLEGAKQSIIKCYYEPGQYIFTLNELTTKQVSISIDETRSTGNINIFLGIEDMNKLGRLLLRELERVKMELGIKHYKQAWNYDFPDTVVERLRLAIKQY
jgi:hypothetical protein